MKVRFTRSMHTVKEDNEDLVEYFKDRDLRFCGYEERLTYEYDTKTKDLKLIGAGGYFLGDEEISSGETVQIPDL